MTYIAPFISEAGLSIPTYADILEDLIQQFKNIYGQDCYLEEDSADYQWISILSLRLFDALNSVQLAYNNRGPQTAVGSGLDQVVKINGVTRKAATYSTCELVLTGIIGTVITQGKVADSSGYVWDLPETVILAAGEEDPSVGVAIVTAVCETIGAISALENTISSIVSPTAGWTSVTNLVSAVMGEPVETDAALRERRDLSTTRPSMNLTTGTWAALAAMEDVTRLRVVENYTHEYDEDGNPPHSITCVVEGGADEDIAQTIWENRGIGCLMNGDVVKEITDPISGVKTNVGFYRPEYVPIYVTVNVAPFEGYTTATTLAIQQAVVDYLNALQIGSDLTISGLYAAVMAVTDDIHDPIFSILGITAATVASPQETYDITILFNQVARGELGNIEVAVF